MFQAEDGIRDDLVTGVQTCALPIYSEKEYVEHYIGILEERGITARGLVDELPDGAVLLCYEIGRASCRERV